MSYLTKQKHEEIRAVAQKWAWPGGYPIIAIMGDGEVLCPDCIVENIRQVVYASSDRRRWRDTSWAVEEARIHWEGPDETCAHCGKKIPSAYGDPYSEEEEEAHLLEAENALRRSFSLTLPWGDPELGQ